MARMMGNMNRIIKDPKVRHRNQSSPGKYITKIALGIQPRILTLKSLLPKKREKS